MKISKIARKISENKVWEVMEARQGKGHDVRSAHAFRLWNEMVAYGYRWRDANNALENLTAPWDEKCECATTFNLLTLGGFYPND